MAHDPTATTEREEESCDYLQALRKRDMSHMPIAWRITGWFLIFLFLMLIGLATFVIQFIHLWEDSHLRSDLQRTVVRISDDPSRYTRLNNGIYAVIYSTHGYITRGTLPENFPEDAPYLLNQVTEVKVGPQTYYYYDAPYRTAVFSGWVRGIVPVDLFSRSLNIIITGFITGGSTLIIIAIFGGYWLIRRGLRPVRDMAKMAEEIGRSRDLSKRIQDVPGHDEIHQLSVTFNSMLDSLQKARSREKQFSSDVSHELRTPLSVIQAESEFARDYVSSLDEAKEYFDHIYQQSKFMSSMVTQLLELSRLDKLQKLEKVSISLTDLLNHMLLDYEKITRTKGITLIGTIAENITVDAEPILLQRAIGNLLDNAIKFTKDLITVRLSRKPDGTIAIAVHDNGDGIAAEDIPKIWDRLFQTESSRNRTNNKGVGLGLYFVKNVIKLHGGLTVVDSRVGESTTFTILLPSPAPSEPPKKKSSYHTRRAMID